MSNSSSPTSGLVLLLDSGNGRSFAGSAATNLVFSPEKNSWPTNGNSWGTYNDRIFNAGNPWTLGIASVSGNLVTTSAAHPFVTYDVISPTTTGGGVTAGTNYYVRVWSATTFSLHAYGDFNTINTGVDGLKSLDTVDQDTRVSINSTSFPTAWLGTVHAPNSAGFGKEIIRNGFKFRQQMHDCLRNHLLAPIQSRPYMAYGLAGNVICNAGQPYVFSFYHRAATPSMVGEQIQFNIYIEGFTQSQNFTLSENWQKFSMTFTPNVTGAFNQYFPSVSLSVGAWDISELTLTAGTTVSETTGLVSSRSSTGVFTDLTGNNTVTATSLSYTSTGSPFFNGTSDYLSLGTTLAALTQTGSVTVTTVAKISSVVAKNALLSFNSEYNFFLPGNRFGSTQQLYWSTDWAAGTSTTWATDQLYHLTWTISDTTLTFYVNGEANGTATVNRFTPSLGGTARVGLANTGEYAAGTIPYLSVHNRALSASEVRQSFIGLRTRFGI